MGTRHLIAVVAGGEYKIAQYAQWDGHIERAGIEVLEFLRDTKPSAFKETLKNVRWLTQDEWQEIIDKHTDDGSISWGSKHEGYWKEHLAHLSRYVGTDILVMVRDGKANKLRNSIGFAGDSLFCEYAYVVDYDKGVFEIYKGFNKELIQEGRFVSGSEDLEKSDGYEPVKLIKTYDLDSLPSDEEFVSELDPSDEAGGFRHITLN